MSQPEQDRQAAYTATWEAIQADLANPEVQARVRASLARIDASPGPRTSRAEFLARIELLAPTE